MVSMTMMDDSLGRGAVIESPRSSCIFVVAIKVVVFLENKPHSHGVSMIWCCCCVAAIVICCSQFVRGGKKKQKQKHASVCTRVRNNVFDEAAHNVPMLRPPLLDTRKECYPFLSIHNGGASLWRHVKVEGTRPSPTRSHAHSWTEWKKQNKRLWL